ncbi:hypothetical protein ACVWZR_010048 [Bradyrhizobium sp. i1.3.1]
MEGVALHLRLQAQSRALHHLADVEALQRQRGLVED